MAKSGTAAKRAAKPRPKAKQAVVIVHGMGEQRPLGTLRSFAEAVWGGSTVPDEDKPNQHNDLWIVPDTRAGLKELARVRTRNVTAGGRDIGTDFYELYWADKLTGNTFTQFRTWLFTLLLRWPHQVPRETVGIWLGLWAVTLAIIGLLVAVGSEDVFTKLRSLFISDAAASDQPAAFVHLLRTGGSAALAVIVFIIMRWRLLASLKSWTGAGGTFASTWQKQSAAAASLPVLADRLAAIAIPLLAAAAAYCLFPWSSFPWARGAMLLAALLLTFAITAFVVPYLGDVARYVRAAPDAVSARADIRERGLDLLRALHGVSGRETDRTYDFGNETPYERIIVVGHSLGSIIAYDVLRLLWEEIGPTGKNPPDGAVLERLDDINNYCKERYGDPDRIDPVEYRRLQAALIEALRMSASGKTGRTWLVSDFVMVGSPLTHAEFLVSPDRNAFEQRKAERQFPTAPPMLEPGPRSFMYSSNGRLVAHHAAMFAATRWVNIYDPPKIGLWGDLVSGPCQANFGPGIVDVPVRIRRPGVFGRMVTHTDYWNQEATSQLKDLSWQSLEDDDHQLESTPPRHIAVLRLAMRLKRRIPKEPRVSDEA